MYRPAAYITIRSRISPFRSACIHDIYHGQVPSASWEVMFLSSITSSIRRGIGTLSVSFERADTKTVCCRPFSTGRLKYPNPTGYRYRSEKALKAIIHQPFPSYQTIYIAYAAASHKKHCRN